MARARNIKPGFFKNEILAELSCETRLLFIGLWTIADREGRFEDRPKRIRAELFPFETFDVDAMLEQLQAAGFLRRYEVDDVRYVEITNFVKHQDPHYKEKASVIPPPLGETNKLLATNVTRTQRQRILERDGYKCQQCGSTEHLCIDHILPVSRGGDSSDENLQVLCFSCNTKKSNKLDGEKSARKRNKHNEYANFDPIKNKTQLNIEPTLDRRNGASPSSSLIPDSLNLIPDPKLSIPDGMDGGSTPAAPACPHDDIIAAYHELLPTCPQVREWHKTRQGLLKSRWREDPKRQTLEWWRKYFAYVAESDFLTGRAEPRKGSPPFVATLEWLLRPTNFANVREGKYHNAG